MTKTHDTGGKGRKQCGGCKKYVGARISVCLCGFKFTKSEATTKEIKTHDTGGKGRKQCGGCKKYVGARISVCLCGFNFNETIKTTDLPMSETPKRTEQVSEEREEARERAQAQLDRFTLIHTPGSGMMGDRPICPCKLLSTESRDVIEWINACQDTAARHRSRYTKAAFVYMAATLYERGTQEHTQLRNAIVEHFDNIM